MRSRLISGYALLTVALLLTVIAGGCISGSPTAAIGNGSFVFIEYHDSLRSRMVQGNQTVPLILDDPLYFYDDKNRVITLLFSSAYVRNQSGLRVLYGETVDCPVAREPVAWGTSKVYTIDQVPASAGGSTFGSPGVTVNDVRDNGTVSLVFRNTSITLKPGESWTGIWSDQEQFNVQEHVILELNRSETITNHGIFDLSQVIP